MTKLTPDEIQALGFEWPHDALIAANCVEVDGRINLTQTIANLQSGRAYHQAQVNAAYRFKQQTGADYADFTDRFDDHVRQARE